MEPPAKKDTEESKDYLLTRQETRIVLRLVAGVGSAAFLLVALTSPQNLSGGFVVAGLMVLLALAGQTFSSFTRQASVLIAFIFPVFLLT